MKISAQFPVEQVHLDAERKYADPSECMTYTVGQPRRPFPFGAKPHFSGNHHACYDQFIAEQRKSASDPAEWIANQVRDNIGVE